MSSGQAERSDRARLVSDGDNRPGPLSGHKHRRKKREHTPVSSAATGSDTSPGVLIFE